MEKQSQASESGRLWEGQILGETAGSSRWCHELISKCHKEKAVSRKGEGKSLSFWVFVLILGRQEKEKLPCTHMYIHVCLLCGWKVARCLCIFFFYINIYQLSSTMGFIMTVPCTQIMNLARVTPFPFFLEAHCSCHSDSLAHLTWWLPLPSIFLQMASLCSSL